MNSPHQILDAGTDFDLVADELVHGTYLRMMSSSVFTNLSVFMGRHSYKGSRPM
jgi:hypothetical protein